MENIEIEKNQTINDQFYMINAGKELEKNILLPNRNSNNDININNLKPDNNYNYNENQNRIITDNNIKENINLEKEVKELKISLTNFEENYGYISPYHDDIIIKLKEKKQIQNLDLDICHKIYELYKNKYYNDCYDLWSLYGFKPLLFLSPEENYEILRHLTKVKDDLYRRKYLLNNLDNFNLFNDNNYNFETGISFEPLKKIKNLKLKERPSNNIINNSSYNINNYSGMNNDIIININNESVRTLNDDIVKQKINQNNLMLEELKKKVFNYSYN